MKIWIYFISMVGLFSCTNPPVKQPDQDKGDTAVTKPMITVDFNGDSAYLLVKQQVDFGPRVPGSAGHTKCHNYLVNHFKKYADTLYLQNSTAKTFDKKNIPVKNIIAAFNPQKTKRILLCAHWDTRPFADQDTKDKDKPILGANDGASGVAVLMEITKNLAKQKPDIGVDIILFDAEDWGDPSGQSEDSYCLGSQYWGNNLHVPNYKADFGILLDMVGAPNAMFGFESYSMSRASNIVSLVWETAANAGYDNYFKNFNRGGITDDHFYIMKLTNIPTIDIIDFDPTSESRFGKYWHTHNDNMDAIDAKTLKAVGQTVQNVVYNY